jgi:Zn-dependent M16 (insulinase) family peptidase
MNQALASAPEHIHPAFELRQVCPIDALHIVVEEYQHRVTGAIHYHLRTDNKENVFLVALKTIPTDSTGVAHILEHTVLCGSEHYPVRDPFFLMLRRSLNTFMNAMTSSDWTAYPFASQNRKDFDNLLRVYLDAVFFARLDPLDFAQEGHRQEFEEPDNSDSALLFKGVVFNEMKGAMSSIPSTLWQTLTRYLYPTTTYHYNSGGDPEAIPDLSYDQLLSFYRKHYHPSNAVFMTFGDIPACEHQQLFETLALHRFERQTDLPRVPDEKRYLAPLRVSDHYALEGDDDIHAKTHIVMGWLLGKNTDLKDLLEAHFLAGVLLDNSASPLLRALETTELGTAPSPLCGMDDSNRELVFVCGIEGSESEHGEALEQLVLGVLEDIATQGVAQEQLAAVLHQLELHQREIGGDGSPYGLQLIMQCLGTAMHHGDPISLLDLDPVLAQMGEAITDPDYIKQLVRRLLLNNQHRVTLTQAPNTELAQRRVAAEADRLAAIKSQMDASRTQQTVDNAAQLAARQQLPDDESVLPNLGLDDVPGSLPQPTGQTRLTQQTPSSWYSAATNGLTYQQYVLKLPPMDYEYARLLPKYTSMLTDLGIGTADYLQVQARQAATCGSIHAFTSLRSTIDNPLQTSGYLTLSAKALNRNYDEMNQLMLDTLLDTRFDETHRIRELVAQSRAQREQSVTGSGHSLAMLAAASGVSPLAAYNHQCGGIAGIKALKTLDAQLADDQQTEAFGAKLATMHRLLGKAPLQVLTVCEASKLDHFAELLAKAIPQPGDKGLSEFSLPAQSEARHQVWQANTQVNFCAKAFPSVGVAHDDAPVLGVLGGFLRNGYLHSAIREQGGAYGAGASQDSNSGAFLFFSYRDPRTTQTLDAFDASVQWLLRESHSRDSVEQAILGVIGSLDKPKSPAGEAKQHFHNQLFGRTDEQQAQFRTQVLAVTEADLKRVAEQYLRAEFSHDALITSPSSMPALSPWIEQQQAEVFHL